MFIIRSEYVLQLQRDILLGAKTQKMACCSLPSQGLKVLTLEVEFHFWNLGTFQGDKIGKACMDLWLLPQLRWFASNVLPLKLQGIKGQPGVDPGGIIQCTTS